MNRVCLTRVFIFLLILSGLIGFWQTNNIRHYTGMVDIRNRVVGARLMHDGISPYFYNWYPGDPLKYVIRLDVPDSKERRPSPVSASPFFHSLFMPFAFYDEAAIELGCFVVMYALLVIMALIAWKKSKNMLLTLLFFIPFLFTDGWQMHIIEGQYYMLFGFLLFGVAYSLLHKKYVFAGCLFAALVLFRLNAVLLCLPFIFMLKRYRYFYLSFGACMLVYGLFVLSSPFQQKNWTEYFENIRLTAIRHLTPYHQDPVITTTWIKMDTIMPPVFEGKDISPEKQLEIDAAEKAINFESSNLFLFVKNAMHRTPSNIFLQITLLLSLAGLMLTLLLKKRHWGETVPAGPLILSGLLLYELSCFMSPVLTFPYQMSQWMAVAAFVIIFNKSIPRWAIGFFLTGIVMNMAYFPVFKGKHVLGDMVFIIGTFLIIVKGRWTEMNR